MARAGMNILTSVRNDSSSVLLPPPGGPSIQRLQATADLLNWKEVRMSLRSRWIGMQERAPGSSDAKTKGRACGPATKSGDTNADKKDEGTKEQTHSLTPTFTYRSLSPVGPSMQQRRPAVCLGVLSRNRKPGRRRREREVPTRRCARRCVHAIQWRHPARVDILRLEARWKEIRMSSIEVRERQDQATEKQRGPVKSRDRQKR
jgi:hypothetical protein